jgi:hypothetical protein
VLPKSETKNKNKNKLSSDLDIFKSKSKGNNEMQLTIPKKNMSQQRTAKSNEREMKGERKPTDKGTTTDLL